MYSKDFKYGCIGYSVFLDDEDSLTDKQHNKEAEWPFCVGLEVLLDRSPSTADNVPAHLRKSEEMVLRVLCSSESHTLPQPQTYMPAAFPGDEYWSRFKRNTDLVASGWPKM